jgi:hypothetical protein
MVPSLCDFPKSVLVPVNAFRIYIESYYSALLAIVNLSAPPEQFARPLTS